MSINDLAYAYFKSLGYTGSLQDMWSAWYENFYTWEDISRYLEAEGFSGPINEALCNFFKYALDQQNQE